MHIAKIYLKDRHMASGHRDHLLDLISVDRIRLVESVQAYARAALGNRHRDDNSQIHCEIHNVDLTSDQIVGVVLAKFDRYVFTHDNVKAGVK